MTTPIEQRLIPAVADRDAARLSHLLTFFRIDAGVRRTLLDVRSQILEALPEVLDHFYHHVGHTPEIALMFRDQAHIEHAKAAQLRHWDTILRADFGTDYIVSVRRIATAHSRLGLGTALYVGGYSFLMTEMIAAVLARYTRGVSLKNKNRQIGKAQRALIAAVNLDIGLCLEVYLEIERDKRLSGIDQMVERIDADIADAVDDMGGLIREVHAAAERMSVTIDRTQTSTAAAASASGVALQSAQTVASAAEQLHASIAEIARQTGKSAEVVHEAVRSADHARSVMDSLVTASQEIGRVVDVINAVASQTNLLALNATIEAARAGAAGKGFAVVASEVKTLAGQTANATKDIIIQISRIREVTGEATTAMTSVGGVIRDLESSSTTIAAAIDQQSAATEEISRSVHESAEASRKVAEIMEGLAAETEGVAELADEVTKDTERMASCIGGLGQGLKRTLRSSAPEADRRRDHRYNCLIQASLTASGQTMGGQTMDGAVIDLSCGGLAFQPSSAAIPLSVGATVSVTATTFGAPRQGRLVAWNGVVARVAFDAESRLTAAQMKRIGYEGGVAIVERAKTDHIAFIRVVMEAVEGRSATRAADLANHHTCRLGRWYDGVNDATIRGSQAFVALSNPHRRVHEFGKKALACLSAGDPTGARQAAAGMSDASREVLELLDHLKEEILQAAKKQ